MSNIIDRVVLHFGDEKERVETPVYSYSNFKLNFCSNCRTPLNNFGVNKLCVTCLKRKKSKINLLMNESTYLSLLEHNKHLMQNS